MAVFHGATLQNVHIIWVRQGERAHYVMRVGDPGTNANRTTATIRRWSPFNVTVRTASQWNQNLDQRQPPVTATSGGGAHTLYPSQAGAFFMWAGSHNRRAWAPVGGLVGTWGSAVNNVFWNALAAVHETCPPGFRRPNDGVTHQAALNDATTRNLSEMRQSLFLNPQLGSTNDLSNSVWGFYADGFSDRRAISDNTIGGGAVANDVAYIGRLFINPHTGYHLFLPAAGLRNTTGALSNAGNWGYYWSSSAHGALGGWGLRIASGSSHVDTFNRANGFSVRCVSE